MTLVLDTGLCHRRVWQWHAQVYVPPSNLTRYTTVNKACVIYEPASRCWRPRRPRNKTTPRCSDHVHPMHNRRRRLLCDRLSVLLRVF